MRGAGAGSSKIVQGFNDAPLEMMFPYAIGDAVLHLESVQTTCPLPLAYRAQQFALRARPFRGRVRLLHNPSISLFRLP